MASPTERTLKYFRDYGWQIGVVERWIERTRKRVDLFGFGDLVAFKPGDHFWGQEPYIIQATSTANISSRVAKIKSIDAARDWMDVGGILVIGWKKYATPVGGRWWRPTIQQMTKGSFCETGGLGASEGDCLLVDGRRTVGLLPDGH
jgi:hypothetical protein